MGYDIIQNEHICDICSKEISYEPTEYGIAAVGPIGISLDKNKPNIFPVARVEICVDCAKDIVSYIRSKGGYV